MSFLKNFCFIFNDRWTPSQKKSYALIFYRLPGFRIFKTICSFLKNNFSAAIDGLVSVVNKACVANIILSSDASIRNTSPVMSFILEISVFEIRFEVNYWNSLSNSPLFVILSKAWATPWNTAVQYSLSSRKYLIFLVILVYLLSCNQDPYIN